MQDFIYYLKLEIIQHKDKKAISFSFRYLMLEITNKCQSPLSHAIAYQTVALLRYPAPE